MEVLLNWAVRCWPLCWMVRFKLDSQEEGHSESQPVPRMLTWPHPNSVTVGSWHLKPWSSRLMGHEVSPLGWVDTVNVLRSGRWACQITAGSAEVWVRWNPVL
jgi:hypothetical protein